MCTSILSIVTQFFIHFSYTQVLYDTDLQRLFYQIWITSDDIAENPRKYMFIKNKLRNAINTHILSELQIANKDIDMLLPVIVLIYCT